MTQYLNNKKPLCGRIHKGVKKIGDTYFRTGRHYHRLWKLNYCVRNGNRCFLPDMVAKKGR